MHNHGSKQSDLRNIHILINIDILTQPAMESYVCRICLRTGKNMVSIFKEANGLGISFAFMISDCTGFKVDKGDRFPKAICTSCQQDAKNAFEIKQTYERSHQVFCQFMQNSKEDLLLEEVYNVSNCESIVSNDGEEPYRNVAQIAEEKFEDLRCTEKPQCFLNIYDSLAENLFLDSNIDDYADCDPSNAETDDDNNVSKGSDEHPQTHEGERQLKVSNALTINSKLTDTRERPFKCSKCSKAFLSKSNLLNHVQAHKGERPYKCTYCPKTFNKTSNLRYHVRRHTGERPFKCTYCSKGFITNSHLQKHLRIHTGERPFGCSYCSKAFSRNSTLQIHLRTHTGKRPYNCTHCSKAFSRSFTLQVHIRSHTGERPYECTHCPKAFTSLSHLQAHLKIHTGERQFKCSNCSKSFIRKSQLQRHELIHTEGGPFKCTHCPKSCKLNSHLQSHLRLHTGEIMSFKCSHCPKIFTRKFNLKKHLRVHTEESPFTA
ncbi:zinc finger protein 501-like isoform X1 [Drosophila rhopaloa]|uniref:Zinc finger protein OZF-like n=2 Tax=Drosophila rhopaloa TaxID=1041015 RepID=A0ABM5HB48_DRORH|nr:zinc finger protein 501-like isoform X1 [Drosophila rhopaloa]